MRNGRYAGPSRSTWDTGGCTEENHIITPRDPWWWHHQRTPDVSLCYEELPNYAGISRNRHTGYFGVEPRRGRYLVRFGYERKTYRVGWADSPEEGARMYDDYVKAHGMDRPLNDIEESA